jgi:predicted GIY-YIG superfamily endonuclease
MAEQEIDRRESEPEFPQLSFTAAIAQLVRAQDCDSWGRGFESRWPPQFRMYFVYVLACLQTGRTYVGHTDNLIARYRAHCAGSTRTSREKMLEIVVVHWERCPTRSLAMQRERYYKSGSGHRVKREIIAMTLREFWPERSSAG